MTRNPFLTYGYAGPEYFCDRVVETKRLTTLLTNGNHVALISPRRMGKTGLIKHCFAQSVIQENYYTFLVDIYATTSLAEFTYQLGAAILNTLKSRGRKAWETFVMAIGSLRQGITLDDSGKPSWNLEIGDIRKPEISLGEIFRYLAEADKPCLVAIDEFQTIGGYKEKNVEAMLRTHIQNCTNAWFVFSGSQRHMMGEIFTSPARPFYQCASILPLKAIDKLTYCAFISSMFEKHGKGIAADVPPYIYDMVDGTTWYIQKICNELFAYTDRGAACTMADTVQALQYILDEKSDTYQDMLLRLTTAQRQLLIALCKEGEDAKPTSAAFIKKYSLSSASTVQRSLSALLDRDILTSDTGRYYVYDYFLKFWMRREVGM